MDLTAAQAAADKELTTLKGQLAALQTSFSEENADLQAQLKRVRDELASSVTAKGVLEEKSKRDDAMIAGLRTQKELDSKNIASLTGKLTSLTSESQTFKSNAKQTIGALQNKATNDKSEIANLHARVADLEASLKAAADENEALKQQLSEIKGQAAQG